MRKERPVTFVSRYEAARFVNWLRNGQPIGAQGAGTTETGAYNLLDPDGTPIVKTKQQCGQAGDLYGTFGLNRRALHARPFPAPTPT